MSSSKNFSLYENIRIFRFKQRLRNLYKKKNFKTEFKPMIEKLQEKLHQVEIKQSKAAKMGANIG